MDMLFGLGPLWRRVKGVEAKTVVAEVPPAESVEPPGESKRIKRDRQHSFDDSLNVGIALIFLTDKERDRAERFKVAMMGYEQFSDFGDHTLSITVMEAPNQKSGYKSVQELTIGVKGVSNPQSVALAAIIKALKTDPDHAELFERVDIICNVSPRQQEPGVSVQLETRDPAAGC